MDAPIDALVARGLAYVKATGDGFDLATHWMLADLGVVPPSPPGVGLIRLVGEEWQRLCEFRAALSEDEIEFGGTRYPTLEALVERLRESEVAETLAGLDDQQVVLLLVLWVQRLDSVLGRVQQAASSFEASQN